MVGPSEDGQPSSADLLAQLEQRSGMGNNAESSVNNGLRNLQFSQKSILQPSDVDESSSSSADFSGDSDMDECDVNYDVTSTSRKKSIRATVQLTRVKAVIQSCIHRYTHLVAAEKDAKDRCHLLQVQLRDKSKQDLKEETRDKEIENTQKEHAAHILEIEKEYNDQLWATRAEIDVLKLALAKSDANSKQREDDFISLQKKIHLQEGLETELREVINAQKYEMKSHQKLVRSIDANIEKFSAQLRDTESELEENKRNFEKLNALNAQLTKGLVTLTEQNEQKEKERIRLKEDLDESEKRNMGINMRICEMNSELKELQESEESLQRELQLSRADATRKSCECKLLQEKVASLTSKLCSFSGSIQGDAQEFMSNLYSGSKILPSGQNSTETPTDRESKIKLSHTSVSCQCDIIPFYGLSKQFDNNHHVQTNHTLPMCSKDSKVDEKFPLNTRKAEPMVNQAHCPIKPFGGSMDIPANDDGAINDEATIDSFIYLKENRETEEMTALTETPEEPSAVRPVLSLMHAASGKVLNVSSAAMTRARTFVRDLCSEALIQDSKVSSTALDRLSCGYKKVNENLPESNDVETLNGIQQEDSHMQLDAMEGAITETTHGSCEQSLMEDRHMQLLTPTSGQRNHSVPIVRSLPGSPSNHRISTAVAVAAPSAMSFLNNEYILAIQDWPLAVISESARNFSNMHPLSQIKTTPCCVEDVTAADPRPKKKCKITQVEE